MTAAAYDFALDDASGAWMVIHLAGGGVARVNGVPQRNLGIDEADDMTALLNRVATAGRRKRPDAMSENVTE